MFYIWSSGGGLKAGLDSLACWVGPGRVRARSTGTGLAGPGEEEGVNPSTARGTGVVLGLDKAALPRDWGVVGVALPEDRGVLLVALTGDKGVVLPNGVGEAVLPEYKGVVGVALPVAKGVAGIALTGYGGVGAAAVAVNEGVGKEVSMPGDRGDVDGVALPVGVDLTEDWGVVEVTGVAALLLSSAAAG